ncbi:MAG: hypothetical protein LBD16_02915 [Oscillospiraceae bacterium]|jgi:hypothetical protein|nr:hypothetical protein [Oscillospiraceae bacterium]
MGKYSLENYERYKTVRCRPSEIKEAIQGCGINEFQTVCVHLGEEPVLASSTLLKVIVRYDELADIERTESGLRRLAARYYRDPRVVGVALASAGGTASKRRLWEAAAEAFSPKRYYVSVFDAEQLDCALKRGFMKGLYVWVDEDVLHTCEAFAQNNAQQLYKQMPVLVSVPSGRQKLAQYAAQWHAAGVEGISVISGWRIALRRLTYPKALTSGGYAPMRFWWTNRGPSFCHEETEVRLRIEKDGRYTDIPINDSPARIRLADRVHNEIVRLPDVEPGVYRLEYGLFTKDGIPLVLANEGRNAAGFYFADNMTIDLTPRPEYRNVWDDFFADGYYPLEDPKQPV